MTLIGLISYKTAQLCILHIKSDEDDLTSVVKRQLGPVWHKVYCVTGGLYLALTGGLYYLLILNTLYSQLNFINARVTGRHLLSKDTFSFSQFSFQWTNFIMFLLFIILINLKSLKLIMKLGEFSFVGIIIFTFYCIVKGFINLDRILEESNNNKDFKVEEIKLFSNEFAIMVGSCAVAFNVHNMIVPIA